MYKYYSFPITLVYFALGGIATYLKYGLTEETGETVKKQGEAESLAGVVLPEAAE